MSQVDPNKTTHFKQGEIMSDYSNKSQVTIQN